jgi:flagellar assembly protein FliH
MSDFTAGFAVRHKAVAQALEHAFAMPPEGFAPVDLQARAARRSGPVSFSPQNLGPKHFEPADPDAKPTEGWDPFEPQASASAFVDPIATAHAAGIAEGLALARAEITEAGERDRTLLADLARALRADDRLDRERMARQLRQTVMFLVTKLVGEIGIAPDLLAGRIDAAADILADSAESAMLRVHPDDVALLEGKLPKSVFAVGDAGVARGGFVLESASTIIEDSPDIWLEQLAQAIDRIAMPASC